MRRARSRSPTGSTQNYSALDDKALMAKYTDVYNQFEKNVKNHKAEKIPHEYTSLQKKWFGFKRNDKQRKDMIDQIIEMEKRMPELDDILRRKLHLERESNKSDGYGYHTNYELSDNAFHAANDKRRQNEYEEDEHERRQNWNRQTHLERSIETGIGTMDTNPTIKTPVFGFQSPRLDTVASLQQLRSQGLYGGKSKRVNRVKRSRRVKRSTKRRKH
jgi:hypothetical protein